MVFVKAFGIPPVSWTGLALSALALASSALYLGGADAQTAPDQVASGKYLADAGDCMSCHTAPKGKPFAGGRGLETPFGTIYTPNITPDKDTGIGAWSQAQFARAMKEGVRADGSHLYPAFPYPYYTKATDQDIDAIYSYLRALEPINSKAPPNKLEGPLGNRFFAHSWEALFFRPGAFQPNAGKSKEWNRGAYLVEGLGHCGACHTPKNTFGADKESASFKGGQLEGWVAPNLTGDSMKGLRDWGNDDVVEYLKTGRNAFAQAGGPMGEVIANSTQLLTKEDLQAIAIYLKDLPGDASKPPVQNISAAVMKSGEAIYLDQCSACHKSNGEGVPQMFPALAGGGVSVQDDPTSIIHVILGGARTVPTDAKPTPSSMPAYSWKLNDAEIAAVASYVRNSWGNAAPVVLPSQVKTLRDKLSAR
jgi:mono/diheme cytochrome c family protein